MKNLLLCLDPYESVTVVLSVLALVVAVCSAYMAYKAYKLASYQQKSLKQQEEKLQQHMYANSYADVLLAQRQLTLDLLSNNSLGELFKKEILKFKDNSDEAEQHMLGTYLINHALLLFYYHSKQMLEEDKWCKLKQDINEMLNSPIVINEWPLIKDNYSNDFCKFIEEEYFSKQCK